MLKSPAFVPDIATLLMVIEELNVFESVPVCDALLDPTKTVPNERLVGLAVTLPPELVPSPETATVCGLPVPLSLKLRVAERVPATVGSKTTLTVQLAEAAKIVLQVLEKI